ncbi:putative membrane protein [Wickerhamomyces ciferrii]|uniref:Membrane protein n=1 Tax=Wickerhamomyces ciferrii (strain ATCC 14091 / BCRC 22168 / CBS 111 / JCM 3599 / NBRC 0793 / NRRL Y-1031 F-60-10) TaxID=1206466 RepID=K0KG71_WICCF|nr:uncharacterized protein BN7_3713 [Wickerhamomyces ciferrii]CCH44155.1 putative membrane protein [Wickerhamomyces ciferrii]
MSRQQLGNLTFIQTYYQGSRLEKHFSKNYGLYCIILGELCASWMLVATKLLEQDTDFKEPISPTQILFVRMLGTYIGCLIYMYFKHVEDSPWGPPGRIRLILVARGISGNFSILGIYIPLVYLAVSDVISLSFLGPICTSIMAYIVLKERFSKFEGIGGLVSLIGVVLIAKPTFIFGESQTDNNVETSDPNDRLFAVMFSLLGVICFAISFTIIRFIGDRVNPVITISYYALVTVVLTFLTILISPSLSFQWPHTFNQWSLLLLIAVTGFIMQYLFTTGLQLETASRAASMSYIQIVFGIIWEVLIWNHLPNSWSWLGISIILGCSISIFWYKNHIDDEFHKIPDEEEHVTEIQVPDQEENVTRIQNIPLHELDPK